MLAVGGAPTYAADDDPAPFTSPDLDLSPATSPDVDLSPAASPDIAFSSATSSDPDRRPATSPDVDLGSARALSDGYNLWSDDSSAFGSLTDWWRLTGADEPAPAPEAAPQDELRRLRPPGPDWAGIGLDTGLFIGAQIVSVAIISVMPDDFNLWDGKGVSFETWWENVKTPPVWDSDHWATNYLAHPYWGATYYIRARERGFGKLASFGYSAVLSTLYEYGAEAFFEIPSAQDLIITPIVGSLLGAFVFEPIRNWVKAKDQFRWYDQAILIVTDPLGVLSGITERLLGMRSTILLQPQPPAPVSQASALGAGQPSARPRAQGFAVSLTVTW